VEHQPDLKRVVTTGQFFALAFSGIVGVAWVTVLGGLIAQAGPFGSLTALAIGGLMIVLIVFCYAEVSTNMPAAGGEVVYAYELSGTKGSFTIGWVLALTYVSACVFEAISLGWVISLLFPDIRGSILYEIVGEDVFAGDLVIGIVATLLLFAVNAVGTSASARMQEAITYLRLAAMLGFVACALLFGSPANLTSGGGVDAGLTAHGFLAVLTAAPFMYSGFSAFATAMEERSGSSALKAVGWALVGAVGAAILFYGLLIIGISSLLPWQQLVTLELPTATVFRVALGAEWITQVVLATAVLGVITAWNALLMGGARVLLALGRAHVLPARFARVDKRGAPIVCLVFVTLVTIFGAFLGRGLILPIVNVTSLAFALAYAVTCLTALRLRRDGHRRDGAFAVPGGAATIRLAVLAAAGIGIVAFITPWLSPEPGIPAEFKVMVGWALLGILFWLTGRSRRAEIGEPQRRQLLVGTADNRP